MESQSPHTAITLELTGTLSAVQLVVSHQISLLRLLNCVQAQLYCRLKIQVGCRDNLGSDWIGLDCVVWGQARIGLDWAGEAWFV